MKRFLLALTLATSIGFSSLASAVTIAPTPPPVSIQETFDSNTGQGEFTVTNNSGDGLFAFFVANETATQADKSDPVLASWKPALITRTEWESGTISFPNAGSSPEGDESFLRVGSSSLWTPPDTTTIDWATTFGANATKALGYWSDGFGEVPQAPIADGATQGGFIFYASAPNSPFIAFGSDGTIGQGSTNVVPVPAAVWLFGSGLLGLIGIARRKRA